MPGAGPFPGRPLREAWAPLPPPRRGHRRPLRTTLITSVNRWSSLLRSPRESRVLKLLSGLQILSIGQCLWIRGKPFLSPKASKTEVRYILPWTPSFSLKCHLLKGHQSFFDRKEDLFTLAFRYQRINGRFSGDTFFVICSKLLDYYTNEIGNV